ncbi:MAG: hypothetical protein OEV21_06700, partial [Thermoplasmata archaeon]|nr:hypothetical protein [Thermoplasmata archaeon]
VSWIDDRTGPSRIRVTQSYDGGETFESSKQPWTLNRTSDQTCASLVANGRFLYLSFCDDAGSPRIYHPYVSFSRTAGEAFYLPIRLDSTGSSGAYQRNVRIAAHPNGGVIAVWEDNRNRINDWYDFDIYGIRLTRDGEPMGSDFRIDDGLPGSYQMEPTIAIDKYGNVYVAWVEERNDKDSIRFSYAASGQTVFQPSFEISSSGQNFGQKKPVLSAIDPNIVFIAWQEDSEGTYDIYFSRGEIPELNPNLPEFQNMIIPILATISIVTFLGHKNRT